MRYWKVEKRRKDGMYICTCPHCGMGKERINIVGGDTAECWYCGEINRYYKHKKRKKRERPYIEPLRGMGRPKKAKTVRRIRV